MSLGIGVLASHGGSNMQAIVDAIEAGGLDARIVLVVSNNSASGALERARRHGLPCLHLSGSTHPDPASLDEAIATALRDAGAEVVVLAGYMKKIGPRTLAAFAGRILNIHPALLPRHGGPGMYGIRPHEAVLAAGDRESGATVHVVDERYDHGPVLRQRRVPVLPGDTPESLQERVLAQEHRIYTEVLADIVAGRIALPVRSS
jgi:phosphoribosylglycinamide formyltransferase-1